MVTLKGLAGKSIIMAIAVYSLLLVLFPVGWIILIGTAILRPSAEKSIEEEAFGSRPKI